MFLTTGPASPFFVFFVFSLICATLRWQWRGAMYTAAIAISVVIVMAVYPADLLREPEFEMNRSSGISQLWRRCWATWAPMNSNSAASFPALPRGRELPRKMFLRWCAKP